MKIFHDQLQKIRIVCFDDAVDRNIFFLHLPKGSLPSLQAAEAEQMRLFPLVLSFTSKQDHFLCR
jgi:hypothetical protein